jgi:DNA processing protein
VSSFAIKKLLPTEFPPLLHEIPQPPTELWSVGNLPPPELKLLAVVGSRKYTTYGKQIVDHLLSGLAGYPVGIVSGLAIGIDGLAHESAIRHGLYTLSVPGSGLDESVLYPASHRNLARTILETGGGLLSELSPLTPSALWTFPKRNRIMAGMCQATLLIESGAKSGTLITARMCVDYNRELLVVPGNIFSPTSVGNHQFLKLGATPVTEARDILLALGIEPAIDSIPKTAPLLSPLQQKVVGLLRNPTDRDELIRLLNLPTHEAGVLLMQMEMQGIISLHGNLYSIHQ